MRKINEFVGICGAAQKDTHFEFHVVTNVGASSSARIIIVSPRKKKRRRNCIHSHVCNSVALSPASSAQSVCSDGLFRIYFSRSSCLWAPSPRPIYKFKWYCDPVSSAPPSVASHNFLILSQPPTDEFLNAPQNAIRMRQWIQNERESEPNCRAFH